MIKFFRRIRQTLLSQNRFAKYLLYAIGEIVLVVIGILIALEINNRNELQKNEETVNLAFKEIQNNLLEDISNANEIANFYLRYDSIQKKVLDFENPLSEDDYKQNRVRRIGIDYQDFVINKDGYEYLMRIVDKIPAAYVPILKDLQKLYVYRNYYVLNYNDRVRSTAYSQIDFISAKKWRVQEMRFSKISKEELDYYIHDDHYKAQALNYMNDLSHLFRNSQIHRIKAIESYIKIDSLLNKKGSEIPYRQLGQIKDASEVAHLLGSYTCADPSIPYNFKLILEDGYIYGIDNVGTKTKNYRIDDNLFMFMVAPQQIPGITKIIPNKEGVMIVDFLNVPLTVPDFVKVD